MLNPFDPKTVLLAKHAQHVVFIHFPIALFLSAVAFDALAQCKNDNGAADAAYYNLLTAAIFTVPTLISGILAWRIQLDGERLHGLLLLHLVMGVISSVVIWLSWWLHLRGRKHQKALPRHRLALELLGVVIVAITGHLGGFLSGVSLPT